MLDWVMTNWLWLVLGGLFVWMHTRGHGCGGHGHGDQGRDAHRQHHEQDHDVPGVASSVNASQPVEGPECSAADRS